MALIPLLRSPPFPGITAGSAAVSRADPGRAAAPIDGPALFAAIREARVGGAFWAVPGRDPWSLVAGRDVVEADGDDELAAIARIAGVPVRLTGPGRFADEAGVVRALAAVAYRDPFTGAETSIGATIELLALWRRTIDANRGIAAAAGFAFWKRREMDRFLWAPRTMPLRFTRSAPRAVKRARRAGGGVAIWPSRVTPAFVDAVRAADVPLVRIEDGFIRSVGLGANLFPPQSVAIDARGIHYDPSGPSDLEHLLATADFPPALVARAEALTARIVATGLGKYGRGPVADLPPRDPTRRLVLVAGQVDDDMSVRLGGGAVAGNRDLLARVRALEPDAEIWFRPHPDVDAGHRAGAVADADALDHVDRVVRGGGMAALLDGVDGVHVLTSLAGFEALLRGRDVTVHGRPFYAGWGLTRDVAGAPDRRGRTLGLAELVAATLILYPRYLDPVTALPCPVETLVDRFAQQHRPHATPLTRLRVLQGRLFGRRRALSAPSSVG